MDGDIQSVDAHTVGTQRSLEEELNKVIILRDGDTLAVLTPTGDVITSGLQSLHGVFHDEMRHSGRLRLTINDAAPELVSYSLDNTTTVATIHLRLGNFKIIRTIFLAEQSLAQRIVVKHEGSEEITAQIRLEADTDFENIFHIRGDQRARRRADDVFSVEAHTLNGHAIQFHYSGIMGSTLQDCSPPLATIVHFATEDARLKPNTETDNVASGSVSYLGRFASQQTTTFYARTLCNRTAPDIAPAEAFNKAMQAAVHVRQRRLDAFTQIAIPGPVGEFFDSAVRDLNFLLTETPQGLYPYAGTPVFNREFGRDGIIAALFAELLDPEIELGVLRRLAARQATTHDPFHDAEPGKIPHELSKDHASGSGRLPYDGCCSSADSTPLWLMLGGAIAHKYIADRSMAERILRPLLPNFELALAWIDEHSNPDVNGFARYARKTADGLATQVWKDSENGIVHANGEIAAKPVAVVEVQGYIYAGLKSLATIYEALGNQDRAASLRDRAATFRDRIEANFWRDHLDTYALAIDGNGKHCDVMASNAGHMLWTGVASPPHADKVVEALMGPDLFSGWAVRTLAMSDVTFDPNGYHIGSICPHDNAIIAIGFAKYGYKEEAARILQGMHEAFVFTGKIPELFRGDPRVSGVGPEPYREEGNPHVLANDPQAWAAGAPIAILQALLGIERDAKNNTLNIDAPYVPDFFPDTFQINGIKINGANVDIEFEGKGYNTRVKVLSSENNIHVNWTRGQAKEAPFAPEPFVVAAIGTKDLFSPI